jgi:hypothetical protein
VPAARSYRSPASGGLHVSTKLVRPSFGDFQLAVVGALLIGRLPDVILVAFTSSGSQAA